MFFPGSVFLLHRLSALLNFHYSPRQLSFPSFSCLPLPQARESRRATGRAGSLPTPASCAYGTPASLPQTTALLSCLQEALDLRLITCSIFIFLSSSEDITCSSVKRCGHVLALTFPSAGETTPAPTAGRETALSAGPAAVASASGLRWAPGSQLASVQLRLFSQFTRQAGSRGRGGAGGAGILRHHLSRAGPPLTSSPRYLTTWKVTTAASLWLAMGL